MPSTITATQRAIWDRLKAENHPSYRHTIEQALRDNTASPRYASSGRWSALAYQLTGDPAFAQRAYDHIKNSRLEGTFETAAVLTGNGLRETGTEFVITLDWIRDALTPAEVDAYRAWLERIAASIIGGPAIRLNDSDQVTGTYFFLATLDKVCGTSYLAHPVAVAMRDAIETFCEVLSEGGQWMESSEYNLGTLYLLFNGAAAVGIEHYPDIAKTREAVTRHLPHTFTPDLEDTFEWGDEQTPHDPHWLSLENLLAVLNHHSPELRAFEDELRACWNKPATAPFYPRYFVWADPFGERKPWREWAGTFIVAKGVGQVHARTGWSADDSALMAHFPSFSKGEVDHTYAIFGDFRLYRKGWKIDHPIAYSSSLKLANHTILAGLPASTEVGLLTGAQCIPGKLVYVSGTNAGANVAPRHYQPPPTCCHEKTRTLYDFPDRGIQVVLERLHIEDPKTLPRLERYSAAARTAIASAPLVQTIWHSQDVHPALELGTIVGESRITPLYPANFEIVDMATESYGTIHPSEKKWYTRVIPQEVNTFFVLATLIGDAQGSVEFIGDVHVTTIRKPGFPDLKIVTSAVPGPKLTTTIVGNVAAHDPSKLDGILVARRVSSVPVDTSCDVVIDRGEAVAEYRPRVVSVPPPPAVSPAQALIGQLRTCLEELGELVP